MINAEKMYNRLNKITISLISIASGILTNILYDILAEKHYCGILSKYNIRIIEMSKFSLIEQLILIFLIFITIWIILSFFIPVLIKIINSTKFHDKPLYSRSRMINEYILLKTSIIKAQEDIDNLKLSNENYTIIFYDICSAVMKFYRIFNNGNLSNKRIVETIFKQNNSSIKNVINKIPLYEYLSILNISQSLLKKCTTKIISNHEGLKKDYSEINIYIEELKRMQ